MSYRLFLLVVVIYSFFVNLRILPFCQAIKVPILCVPRFKIHKHKNSKINILSPIHFGMIKFGFKGAETVLPAQTGCFILGKNSTVNFYDSIILSSGTVCRIDDNASIRFGSGFSCNNGCFIRSSCSIIFGHDVLIGWNVSINTSDGHKIFKDGTTQPIDGEIVVGNHVWIASYSSIGKNSEIGDNCIVGQMSLVNKKFTDQNCLICGIPAKIARTNIDWQF